MLDSWTHLCFPMFVSNSCWTFFKIFGWFISNEIAHTSVIDVLPEAVRIRIYTKNSTLINISEIKSVISFL